MDLKIEEMYAFIATEEDGQEGICAFQIKSGLWMPMVGADLKRVDSLRPMAKAIAKATGKRIEVCKFTNRQHLEMIEGGNKGDKNGH